MPMEDWEEDKYLKKKRLSVRMEEEPLRRFGELCRQQGTTPSHVIRDFIFRFIARNSKTPRQGNASGESKKQDV